MQYSFLIVEDDQLNQELILSLTQASYPEATSTFITDQADLQQFLETQPKDVIWIVVLDEQLKEGLTGHEVCIELINSDFACYFIGNSTQPDRQSYLESQYVAPQKNDIDFLSRQIGLRVKQIELLEVYNGEGIGIRPK